MRHARPPLRTAAPARGIALIEAMVSMLILSSTLLGVAMLISNGAREQRAAQFMGQASVLASDIAERMRANRRALQLSVPDGTTVPYSLSDTYATLSAGTAITTPSCGGQFIAPGTQQTLANACTTPQDIAAYDLAQWQAQVQFSLAGGAAALVAGPGAQRTIVLAWTEPGLKGAPSSDSTCTSRAAFLEAGAGVRCYVVDFRP